MPALLYLFATLFTWIALYQGILAVAIGPPPDRELVTITGRVDDVDTPWTRNRTVEATQIMIEVAPVRFVAVAVRQVSLGTAELRLLLGKTVTVVYAGGRPRNRWVYGLTVDGRTLISLPHERDRDQSANRQSVGIMLLSGFAAAAFLFAAIRATRRRNSISQPAVKIG